MLTLNERDLRNRQITNWWSNFSNYMKFVNQLCSSNAQDLKRLRNVDDCIYKLQEQFENLQHLPCPESALKIQRSVLALYTNLIAALQHLWFGNVDDCQVIYDVAIVNKHMLELYLEEFDLRLS